MPTEDTRLTIQLPYPPSVNHYWRAIVSGRRARLILSEKGRVYRQEIEGTLLALGIHQQAWNPPERARVHLMAYPPDNRKRDLDNLLKAVLDGLVHGGALLSDSQDGIRELTIAWGEKRPPRGAIVVTISEA